MYILCIRSAASGFLSESRNFIISVWVAVIASIFLRTDLVNLSYSLEELIFLLITVKYSSMTSEESRSTCKE